MTPALARLIAAQVFLHATMAGTRMAAPLLALRAGYSEAAVGVLLALFALTQVFLSLPAGNYADRHGLRRPFGMAVIAAATGAGLAAAFPVFPVLCVSALLTGGAAGTAAVALQRHVGRAAEGPTQLRQVFSWLAIGPAFSNFMGPFFAGLAIDNGGFRLAFLLVTLFPLVSWFWARDVRELPPLEPTHAGRTEPAWDLLREPQFRRLLLVNWLLSSCWDVHTFVVPVLGHERGLSASVIGTILGAFAFAAAAVRVLLPVLAARVKEWAMITAAMVAATALFAIYPLLHSALAMGICSVLLGIALGVVQPMVMSTLHQITPEHRHGQAVGLRLMAINASSVSMPMLFGAAGAVIGIAGVFWTVAAAVASGTRVAWGLRQVQAPGHHARNAAQSP
ncbi:MFS transporter [Ramlibacter sp. MMS24-I3-19]|uniref:MFS transporter n=1 Tax=Ramlibacter sp. MMS24-I3-19 TaxID=3416606 RepID=UPI003CFE0EF0